ncbi:fibronectin type III domain-containing protein [Nocardiopsis sp. ARC36]
MEGVPGTASERSDPVRTFTAPEAPGGVTAGIGGEGTVDVSWEPAGDGGTAVTGYEVTLLADGDEEVAVRVGGDVMKTSFSGLVPGPAYSAVVAAVNGVGVSPRSEPSGTVTLPEPEPEPEPSGPPSEEDLTDPARGGVEVPDTAVVGTTITVGVGEGHVGREVENWLFSTPAHLGTAVVGPRGRYPLAVPAEAPAGRHRLAVTGADGTLIGWDEIVLTLPEAPGPSDPPPDRADPAPANPAPGRETPPGDRATLPFTGTGSAGLILAGLLLALLGLAAVALSRRRSSPTRAEGDGGSRE